MPAEQPWSDVDAYVEERLLGDDAPLRDALEASAAAGLPAISVSPAQGRFLHLLALMVGARRILEIGTLGGYSTICLARALPPDGRLVTLELEPRHAEVAASNLERAGVADRVEIVLGPAAQSLDALAAEGRADPFDLVFIDADKPSIPLYFDRSVGLARPGAAIIVDNVVRNGALASGAPGDLNVEGVRRFHEHLAQRSDVSATTIQTVGAKGYDGFTLAVVGPPAGRAR